jgi:hypothetical protein
MTTTTLAPKQRVESLFRDYFRTNFATCDEFAGVTFYLGQTAEEHKLPSVVFSCENADEVESPGLGLYRARLSVVIRTTIDEKPGVVPADHLLRVDAFTNWLGHSSLVEQMSPTAFTKKVRLFGTVLVGGAQSFEDRSVVDVIDLDVHCQPNG